jgi:hypothetical protein
VEQAQAKLHEALDKSDADALKRTLWLLKRVLALQPSGVNQRLNAAARALRLTQIVEAIVLIRDALIQPQSQPQNQPQNQSENPTLTLEIDVEGLRGLSLRLNRLVDDHDNWQAVERMLSRVEEVMLYDPGELELSWEDLQLRIKPLCPDETLEWVKALREDSANITSALSEKNPAKARRYFQRFRQRAGNQFYQVDSELRTLCDELRKLGEPLASVLKILT